MFYGYLFYCIFLFLKAINKKYYEHEVAAINIMSVLIASNFMSLLLFLSYSLGKRINLLAYTLIVYFSLLCFNYFFLIKSGRYNILVKKYDEKSQHDKNKKWKILAVTLYVLLSIGISIYFALIIRKTRL